MVKAIVVGMMLAMGAGSAFAQAPAKANPDQKFLTEAAKGGIAEVELGKIAVEKGSSPEVKSFGQRMVDDHGRGGEELKTLAKNKSLTLSADIDAKDKALRDRLLKLSGDGFDRAYMAAMLDDHRKDVYAFRIEARSGKDPDVKAWAAKTLPMLTEHLKLAESARLTSISSTPTPRR